MAWQYTMCLQIKQLKTDVPAGTIQPTHQLLIRDAHSAAESVLLSSACAAIYGVMPHVYISSTPSSTNVIVELDRLLQTSKRLLSAAVFTGTLVRITSGDIYCHFSRSYLLPAAVFNAALASCFKIRLLHDGNVGSD